MSWLLWIVLQWTFGCVYLLELWFSPGICPGVGLLGHTTKALFFVFYRTSILFSIVALSVYIPKNSARRFSFLHTFSSIYCLYIFRCWPFFFFFFFSCRLITLQYCSGFCHTLTRISHAFTCIPHPDSPSHLPLHPIPLGLPSAPGPSTCLMHPAWAGDLFHPR